MAGVQDGSPDVLTGTVGDPTVFYGPSAARVLSAHRETETQVLDIAPLDGPLPSGEEIAGTAGGSSPKVNVRAVVKTPAGVLGLLLIAAWFLFDRVFGVAS